MCLSREKAALLGRTVNESDEFWESNPKPRDAHRIYPDVLD